MTKDSGVSSGPQTTARRGSWQEQVLLLRHFSNDTAIHDTAGFANYRRKEKRCSALSRALAGSGALEAVGRNDMRVSKATLVSANLLFRKGED